MTDDATEDKLEQMRKDSTSGGGSRLDAGAVGEDDVVEDLVDALGKVEEGELSKTLSFWDPSMAALLNVLLDDADRAQADAEALANKLGAEVDGDSVDRSDILKLAFRVGLREVDEEIFTDLQKARRERAIEAATDSI